MDGCPRSESNKGPSLDSQSHMRSKRYSSLEFCIWHVLLYSVIIEVYIYVTVLASLNTSYNNNIIVKHFRGLVLGLDMSLQTVERKNIVLSSMRTNDGSMRKKGREERDELRSENCSIDMIRVE